MEEDIATLEYPFRVICVNDTDKPWNIEQEQWVEHNNEYIVTGIFKDLISNELSFKLLDLNPEPRKGFLANRFTARNTHGVN